MSRRIRDMRNLGPVTERMLVEVDICSPEDLRRPGAVAAYRRLKFRFGRGISLNALYALEGALSDRDWREIDRGLKELVDRKEEGSR
ncbi:hypothetical protein BA190_11380 [Labrys sp. WJW]|uniref:TfoX/Sxy family protein n=1 Tax=Labrys sp. WJW TaxID=1737983 RepID=UPI000836C7F2|nr:TfoX/Sxy family protein [Labrys sp. WJW]OCC04982.1 hypothetical protein BA190_11380 [Labrys sp. WJW]